MVSKESKRRGHTETLLQFSGAPIVSFPLNVFPCFPEYFKFRIPEHIDTLLLITNNEEIIILQIIYEGQEYIILNFVSVLIFIDHNIVEALFQSFPHMVIRNHLFCFQQKVLKIKQTFCFFLCFIFVEHTIEQSHQMKTNSSEIVV